MFIIFVMYCMLPVPVKWCTVCCLLTAIIHIIVLAAIVKQSHKTHQPTAVWNVFSIGLLYLGKISNALVTILSCLHQGQATEMDMKVF